MVCPSGERRATGKLYHASLKPRTLLAMLGSIIRYIAGTGSLNDALREIGQALGFIAAAPGRPVVYVPGAPDGVSGYRDWQALHDALPLYAPVIIDDTYQSPAPIPAGVWDKVTTL
jgi:hypothetical protein